MASASLDDYMIQTPADGWSLLGFLEYRKKQNDFSGLKVNEHYRYQMSLVAVQSYNKFTAVERAKAQYCLDHFKDEVKDERVCHFWRNLIQEKQESELITLENEMKISQKKKDLLVERAVFEHTELQTELFYATAQEAGRQSQIIQQEITYKLNVGKRSAEETYPITSPPNLRIQHEQDETRTPENKIDDEEPPIEWEFDTPRPSWLNKVIEEHCLLISKDDPKTIYESSLKSIWWKIVDSSDPKFVDFLSESDLSDLNAVFLSALKNWTVLEPSAEKCLKSLAKLDSYQLRIIGETVRPKGTHGAIIRLQEMLKNIRDPVTPVTLEADDLFCDGYLDEDNKIFHEETPLLDLKDHMDPDVAYIFDLVRYTCEMIAKGIPDRQNSERDIDIFIKRHIFSCFDDILDSHFGEVVSRASRDRRANAIDAPDKAEGYHLDWMFTKHDLGKNLSWGQEFSVCERTGSKIENKRKIISNNLKAQKTLRDMHRSLIEVISAEGGGILSKPILQASTKLIMPGFLSSYFLMRAILIIYVGEGYYSSINLADFDIPTKYEELKSIIEISRIMLQVKKLLSITITRFKLMKNRAKKEKLAPGRVILPVRQKEYRSPQKPKKQTYNVILSRTCEPNGSF
ncbi:15231_t:CDS:10 [Funneliformis geosporum]|nr:15231_t:CDS:10 [Funneliformis geosporum]